MIVAMVSTWPWTKCPPMRVEGWTLRSRFTREEGVEEEEVRREEREVRRRVSGERPTLKDVGGEGDGG